MHAAMDDVRPASDYPCAYQRHWQLKVARESSTHDREQLIQGGGYLVEMYCQTVSPTTRPLQTNNTFLFDHDKWTLA